MGAKERSKKQSVNIRCSKCSRSNKSNKSSKSNKGKTVRLKGPNGTVRVVSADYWAGCTPLNALAEKVKSLRTSNLDASNKSETKCK